MVERVVYMKRFKSVLFKTKMQISKVKQNHLHTILGGATFMAGAVEPMMYVGIKVVLKDNSVLPIYVSKEKVLFNSDKYLNDVKEANDILKELEKRLQS